MCGRAPRRLPRRTYRSATSIPPSDSSVPFPVTFVRGLCAGFSIDGGDVYAAQALDAEVLGEDQEPHVDVVLEPGEGGLRARREGARVVEDADRYQGQHDRRHDPPGPGLVGERQYRQSESHRVEGP